LCRNDVGQQEKEVKKSELQGKRSHTGGADSKSAGPVSPVGTGPSQRKEKRYFENMTGKLISE
jgi:hypothetical protein